MANAGVSLGLRGGNGALGEDLRELPPSSAPKGQPLSNCAHRPWTGTRKVLEAGMCQAGSPISWRTEFCGHGVMGTDPVPGAAICFWGAAGARAGDKAPKDVPSPRSTQPVPGRPPGSNWGCSGL